MLEPTGRPSPARLERSPTRQAVRLDECHNDGPKFTWGGPPLAPKTGKDRLHFDVAPPLGGDQQAEVERLLSLGATRVDIGQGEVSWVVMVDPDGHEFCVLTPR